MTDAEKPIRLLLVEDNPPDALLLRSMLRSQGGFDVLEAQSLGEAEAALARQDFDVALVDLTLPDSSGLATVQALATAAPQVPLVVLSGLTDEEVAMSAVRSGAQDYLIKGRTDADLVARAIRYAIDRKQAEESLRKAHGDLEEMIRERTEELRQANRTLRTISECSQVLVRVAEEQELVQQICQIIVNMGGYRMAWVGYAENDEARSVRPIGVVGFAEGYVEQARISWADTERGRGPTGTCLRTGEARIGHDFRKDPELAPWRDQALARGFRSAIALPLTSGRKIFGALTIYSEQPDAFDSSHVTLLRELADNLAFGIVALRAQTDRDRALEIAEHRSEQLRALAAELVHAEQRERRRLAQILHDHLQQLLIGAKFSTTVIRNKARTKELQRAAEQLSDTLNEAILATRSLTAELSPPVLHEKGLAAGLDWLARQMHEKHGLTVKVEADPRAEPATEQVRLFLFAAVRELLLNIVKYAGVDRATVHLRARDGGNVEVTVADGGAGFDPARLGGEEPTAGGFGLFSIRERIGYLGGHMEVESAPGRGSRFTLVAPSRLVEDPPRSVEDPPWRGGPLFVAQPPSAVPKPPVVALPPPVMPPPAAPRTGLLAEAGRTIRVLLADDHTVMRQGLASLLQEQEGIAVVGQAADGRQAVALARELRPDVVIMDVSMPVMSGVEATRILSAEMPEVRVIALSLHDAADMAASMREAGARAYLSKGGPAEDLVAAIRSC
jgi:DNA-binding NarL/FixJ family response regulator/signal transduction histidine kinase